MLESRGLEIIILAVVVLLLFGAKRLPDSARALGKSLRILKSEVGAMQADGSDSEPAHAAPALGDAETFTRSTREKAVAARGED